MQFITIVVHLAAALGVAAERGAATAPSPLTQLTFKERMIAGAGARGIAQTVLHPIDVVRTRVQAKGVTMNLKPQTFVKGLAPQVSEVWCEESPESRIKLKCLCSHTLHARITRIVHLPFPCPPQFLLAFPAGAIQFAAYEWSKAKLATAKIVGAPGEVRFA